MSTINPILNFDITSKAGLLTDRDMELKFLSYQENLNSSQNKISILCKTEKTALLKGGQSIDAIDVVVGLIGNIVASYIYDLLKDFLVGVKEIKKTKNTVEIETKHFYIKISSDDLNIDEVTELVKAIKSSK